ncbi:hypothetical protein C8R46DRAFT_1350778 [Mycena filopes]|nr:hypothetical protein C8R46DRAFT_1350778 [Mycena filopes]
MSTIHPTTEKHLATFDVPCGRRGCAYVFHYEGHNHISAVLRDHLPNCPGRTSPATPTEWQTPTVLKRICELVTNDAQAVCYSYGRLVPQAKAPRLLGFKVRANPAAAAGSDSKHKGKTRSSGHKSNHVSERRAALNRDPWTQAVSPQTVVCRGCAKSVRLTKLDSEHPYAPGRWIKHRNRCREVNKQRSVERVKARRLKVAMQSLSPEPLYQPTTLRSRRASEK